MPLHLLILVVCLLPAAAVGANPGTVEFHRDVRPILSDRCFTCHGPDAAQRKTPLRFDTEAGAFAALRENRFAIVRGNPEASELYRRITSDSKALRMPPAYAGHDKLSEREIGVIRRWIEQGAPWQKHWSFLPPRRPALPKVSAAGWPRNPIDHFILRKLEAEGLKPSPEAGRAALIRRVSLDLTGLPPTPAEVDAFLADRSTEAYEKVVDRLLASPRYAERMAARWLDAARYADTNGYQSDGVRSMWRWRDWVIDAFGRNMPFDQFTVEQIAGDLLPNGTREQKIATGFHRNHRTTAEGGSVEEEFRVEYVADRVETTSTVWLGLTVGCARCHDHKYDPISQKEFYQLFAYFNNVPERGLVYNFGNEEPFLQAPTPEQEARLGELDEKLAAAVRRWKELEPEWKAAQSKWEGTVRGGAGDWSIREGLTAYYPLDGALTDKAGGCETSPCAAAYAAGRLGKAAEFDGRRYVDAGDVGRFGYVDPFSFAAWIHPGAPNGAILSREEDAPEGEGYGLYLKDGKLWMHITRRWTDISLRLETEEAVPLREWSHVVVTYDGKRKGKGVHIYVNGEPRRIRILFDELTFPYGAREPFKIGAGGGPQNRFRGRIDEVRIFDRALSAREAAVLALVDTAAEIAALPRERRSAVQEDKLAFCFLDTAAAYGIRRARLDALDARTARDEYFESIPTVMVMEEMETPRETFVLKRGAYDAPGEKVAAGVPAVLTPLAPDLPNNRLGLARWLVDPANPLTARVTMNRFWEMLFGTGLVRTLEDFGSQGEWPTHPELLDWLATEFVEGGWDVKRILKTMVTSATYRQESRVTPELLEKDPENRLLARGPRFRLPVETIRDQALALSGLLVEKVGGPSVKPYQPPGLWEELSGSRYVADSGEKLYRRSLYTYWKRTVAPPSMIVFDASDRERCTVRETITNTPLQALNLMNDVAYVEASRKLAERMMKEGGRTPAERIGYGFRLATARAPEPVETQAILRAWEQWLAGYRKNPEKGEGLLREGASPSDGSLDAAELAAYAAAGSLILNLDEVITKE